MRREDVPGWSAVSCTLFLAAHPARPVRRETDILTAEDKKLLRQERDRQVTRAQGEPGEHNVAVIIGTIAVLMFALMCLIIWFGRKLDREEEARRRARLDREQQKSGWKRRRVER